ncbi:hypothetical protein BCR34DRAFT_607529 [Clohesyomyces aquaticus]|uniref:Uncharacterized protein n=1 Tax=Clohesyomyces aquaticus TaxID=1231657 RepID=A0A1Y1YFJ7_9PLEO|nr:hypothetical protein BCR34DRAFT_607529 [Clohesyomyces aquaticus]
MRISTLGLFLTEILPITTALPTGPPSRIPDGSNNIASSRGCGTVSDNKGGGGTAYTIFPGGDCRPSPFMDWHPMGYSRVSQTVSVIFTASAFNRTYYV